MRSRSISNGTGSRWIAFMNSKPFSFFSFAIFASSARICSLALEFSHSSAKLPVIPFCSAQRSRAC
uniref:Uncharacterized protein n=1 Tax=Arundo donax TaxID=35708 RepID=A0A0A9FHB6_ARUDO